MKKLILATSLAAAIATPAFAETKTFDLAGFTSVSASAGVDVTISVGGDYSVVAESTPKGLEKLKVELVGDELRIGRQSRTMSWGRSDRVSVTVVAPALSGVDASSGASVEATGVDAGAFSIDVSSGGDLDIAGRCDALEADVSSGGSIDAVGFLCRTANASASSGGSADIYASESANGDASSGGSVDIHGKPATVNKDTSSGGSVSVQ